MMKTGVLVAGTGVVAAAVTAAAIVYGVPALKRHEMATQTAASVSAPTVPSADHRSSAPMAPRAGYPAQARRPYRVTRVVAVCGNCGIVQSVRRVRIVARPTGGGAILGGIAGAVLGHQLGRGGGRDLATVAGAAGGALIGNHIEEAENAHYVYDVTVLRNSGGVVVLRQPNYVPVGQQVRVERGRAVRR